MADEPKDKQEKQEKKPKSKLPLVIAVGLVALLGGGGGVWFFTHHSKTAEASPSAAASQDDNAPEFVLHLDTFTVNLADAEEGHFLRATIDLGLEHAPRGATEKGAGDFPVARARDAILAVLTVGKADVLLTPEGKTQLKQDILQTLHDKVPEGGVKNVYFTEFIVQR